MNQCSKAYKDGYVGGEIAAIPLMFLTGEGEAKLAIEGAEAIGLEVAEMRTFYTVQDEADAGRLFAGGTPWPTSPTRAHLGEGLYATDSLSQAEAYLSRLEGQGASGLQIITASISEARYTALSTLDLRALGDDAANAWLGTHSTLFGEGVPHGLDHVIRQTGNFGAEFFFSKNIFSWFELR